MDFEMLCRRKKNGMKQAMNELLMITILRISKIKTISKSIVFPQK